jgi:hypothetical protein
MIKFHEQVPSVYPNASRDFQYLCWLIDIVLNSVKHNVDGMYNLPNTNADPKLTELLAMTLGFKVKRNYDQKQLNALVAVLPRILKYKGTKTALDITLNALINASGAMGDAASEVENGELKIILPKDLVDVSLLTDLLPYILPAGMTCRTIRTNQISEGLTTKLGYQDTLYATVLPDLGWDGNEQKDTGLSGLFNVGSDFYEFANYQHPANPADTDELMGKFNPGLLDNTVIPALDTTLEDTKTAHSVNAVMNEEGDNI